MNKNKINEALNLKSAKIVSKLGSGYKSYLNNIFKGHDRIILP